MRSVMPREHYLISVHFLPEGDLLGGKLISPVWVKNVISRIVSYKPFQSVVFLNSPKEILVSEDQGCEVSKHRSFK